MDCSKSKRCCGAERMGKGLLSSANLPIVEYHKTLKYWDSQACADSANLDQTAMEQSFLPMRQSLFNF